MGYAWSDDFDTAARQLCAELANALCAVPPALKETATEIRLLVGLPPQLLCSGRMTPLALPSVTARMLEDSLLSLSGNSMQSHQQELRQGFLSVMGGHRAGVAATAVYSARGELLGLRDPNAIVLRIAHSESLLGLSTARELLPLCRQGFLLSGVPGSGKTTVLRRLAELLQARDVRVVLIDERGEFGSTPVCRLSGYPKADAILMALRALSPQVILCDELGGEDETQAILWSLRCGVSVVATAHAASCAELFRRKGTALLISSGAFSHAALLGDNPVGALREVTPIHIADAPPIAFDNAERERSLESDAQADRGAATDLLQRALWCGVGASISSARATAGTDTPAADDNPSAPPLQYDEDRCAAALCL